MILCIVVILILAFYAIDAYHISLEEKAYDCIFRLNAIVASCWQNRNHTLLAAEFEKEYKQFEEIATKAKRWMCDVSFWTQHAEKLRERFLENNK